jgi:FecR protein
VKRTSLVPIVFLMLAATSGRSAEPLEYRFDEVKSKVLLARRADASHEERASAGIAAGPGDEVKTGFWGHAVLSVPARAARFEIGPSAHAWLAGDEPGVILTIHSGRFKAWFEKLTSGEERVVAVPGALLSVRGTRYGVEVDSGGRVALAVFEGRVQVASRFPGAATIFVDAGQMCLLSPRAGPRVMPMGSMGMHEGSWGMPHDRSGMSPGGTDPGGMPGAAPSGAMPRGSGTPMKGHGG